MIALTPLQKEKLATFKTLLQTWNKTHKLTSDAGDEAIAKNIADSLYPCAFIDTPKSVADIGSGAGYPGLILAVYYEETEFVLFEPLGKKASFLLNCTLEMGLKNVNVCQDRVENYNGRTFDLITSRAVDVPENILILARNIIAPESCFLLYTGESRGVVSADKLIKKETDERRVYLYFAS